MKTGIQYRILSIALVFNVVTLTFFAGVGYYWYRSVQYKNLDTFLQTDAKGIVDAIDGFFEAALGGVGQGEIPEAIDRILESPQFLAAIGATAQTHRDTPQIYKTTTAVFGRQGKRVFVSNNALPIDFPSNGSMSAFDKERMNAENGVLSTGLHDNIEYRAVSIPVFIKGFPAALVQETSLMESVSGSVENLRRLLLVGLPLMWLISGLAMFALLRRAFRPVHDIIDTIHGITGSDLTRRVPLPPADDEIRHLAATFNAMLDRVNAAFEFQSRLVQDLSHQLRTPLAVLKGTLETGLRRVRSADEYQEIMESNLEEVDRIRRLIEGMLLLARLDSKAAPLDLEDVDLRVLIEELRSDLAPLWEQKSITVEMGSTALGGGSFTVRGDAARLRQVFLNILDNAWKYCPEKGIIRVRFTREELLVRTEIQNDGIAIPKADHQRVFERFYRAQDGKDKDEETDRTLGFGLGLPIAQSIVVRHGGRIYVGDPIEGGASFIVELPTGGDSAPAM